VKRLLILVGIVLTVATAHAQKSSKGRFRVKQTTGCAPFKVVIADANLATVGQCTGASNCSMNYDADKSATSFNNTFTFIYTIPGKYKLAIGYPGDPTPRNESEQDFVIITVTENIQPSFDVSACSGNKAIVKITDNNNFAAYSIDYGDGLGFSSPSPTKNYPAKSIPSTQTISVRGVNTNIDGTYPIDRTTCTPKSQVFTPISGTLPQPQIDLLTALDPSQLKIDFTPQTFIQTRIDIATNGSSSFQRVKESPSNTETISSVNLDLNYYCIRLSPFDPCTNSSGAPVAPICSHKITVTPKDGVPTSPNGSIQLDWQTNGGTAATDSVIIYRNSSTSFYQKLLGLPTSFTDPDVICNTNYDYKIVSKYYWPTGGSGKSISLPTKPVKAFTTIKPPAILNTSSDASTNGVQLNWIQDPVSTVTAYSLFRSQNQSTFFSLASSPTTQYQDGSYNSNADFCYLINYKDQCNNGSPDSSPICPIRLRGFANEKNEVSLSWNDYTGWNLGVKNYVVDKYDQNGNPLVASGTIVGNTYVELSDVQNQIVSYKIRAIPNEVGLVQPQSVSNQVTITKEINLFYPTAFTPDGKPPVENETFKVNGQFITKLELSIFDRWGSLIFFTDKNEPWDGTQSGQPMPIASYVWTANIVDLAGRSLKRSGTILLLRK
jgi:gliding motility-associated-like protein